MGGGRPGVAWGWVLPAALAQAVALTVGSGGYGWHRDELYFRMLPPAWGYVDQPPLVPWLARSAAALADEPWALRVPATSGVTSPITIPRGKALTASTCCGGRWLSSRARVLAS